MRLLCALFVALPLSASTLTGRVLDSTKAPLPGVTVESGKRVAVTGADGRYALELPAGTCDVTYRLINFATTVKRGVAVPGSVDVTLYLSTSADVVVTAKQTFRNLTDIDEPVNDLIGIADAATVGVVTPKEIERRPFRRAGEILETIPGVVISQHSGEGKANQYYLRGFNLDHGTDISIAVAGVPVNMPTHAHGQGYADANFLIPELLSGVQYKKGPYYAEEGDFSSAGAVNINYLSALERPIAIAQGGTYGYLRGLAAASPKVGNGYLLTAIEAAENKGPWVHPDDYRRINAILRYSRGGQSGGWSITGMAYSARWNATDQIPQRAVDDGEIPRFGFVDDTDGGTTARYSLSADWQRNDSTRLTQLTAYALKYRLNLFSNFTYFLDDPVNGDQFEQADDRLVAGARASHRWLAGRTENVIGLQLRRDDIDNVGLYHTAARVRLGTIRQDAVTQTSGALYMQSSAQWAPWVRTVAGLRADRYRFDVDSDKKSASLLSPKLSAVFGPFGNTELYANAGFGFHSNDGRGAVTTSVSPLARTKAAEAGVRSTSIPRLHLTAALWTLDIASELVFVGDAGATEAAQASRRRGVEVASFLDLRQGLVVDASYAYSRSRFRDGTRIPGAVEGVASVGLSVNDIKRFSGELRYRYFGPRPLIEDNSVRSDASHLVSARIGYALTPRVRIDCDVLNLLDAKTSDIDYFYTSRLRGEAAPVDDVHFHPVEKRALRFGIVTSF